MPSIDIPSVDLITWLSIALLLYAWWPGSFGRERWTGRLLTLCLLSPGLRYFSSLFSFPVRLKISAWAGFLLNLTGHQVQVDGNMLTRISPGTEPVEMAVDPACMGLQLTGVSLLVSLFSVIWQERLHHKRVPFSWLFGYEMMAFGLTVFCNLFRIVLLVVFAAMPGTLAHEAIGLVCVGVYAWAPAWWMASMLVKRQGKPQPTDSNKTASNTLLHSAGWSFCFLALGIGFRIRTTRQETPVSVSYQPLQQVHTDWHRYATGCRCKLLKNGSVQLSKPNLLIYLKPQTDWISADHSPMSCWPGSGYTLRHVREISLDGHPAYAGELQKRGEILHTLWWFSNGVLSTTSQLRMRVAMLNGATGFVLVNITTDKPLNLFSLQTP